MTTFAHYDEKLNAKIAAKKGEPLDCRIDFDELRIQKNGENRIDLFFWATSCTALAYENKELKKKAEFPGLAFLSIYKPKDNQEDAGKAVLFKYIEQLNPDKAYSGYLLAKTDIPGAVKALTSDTIFEVLTDDMGSFLEIEETPNLDKFDLTAPKYERKPTFEMLSQRVDERLRLIEEQGEKIHATAIMVAALAGLSEPNEKTQIDIMLMLVQ